MRKLLVALGLGSLAVAAIAACVGDAPMDTSSGADGGEQTDATTTTLDGTTAPVDSGAATDSGAGGDSGLVCPGTMTACGTMCVDLKSSAENCNACGRSCGGGICDVGKCTAALFTTQAGLAGFAVDGTSVYMSGNNLVQSCPRGGPCSGGNLKKLADLNGLNYDGVGSIETTNGRIAFIGGTNGHPSLYECPGTGCLTPLVSMFTSLNSYDGLSMASQVAATDASAGTYEIYLYQSALGIAATNCVNGACGTENVLEGKALTAGLLATDSDYYYFPAKAGTYSRCPTSQVPCVDAGQIANQNNVRQAIVTGAETVFLFNNSSGRDEIAHCPVTGCAVAPVSIRTTLNTISSFTANATDVYFVDNVGALMDGAAGFGLHTCPIANCAASSDLTVLAQPPTQMRIDAQFVWWSNASGEIWRIAR